MALEDPFFGPIGLGVSRDMARTIRSDSLELWPGLVLHGMGEVDFHVFGKYWKLTSSPNTSKLVLGPPDWSSDFFESQGTISGAIKPIIFPKNDPKETDFTGTWKTSQNRFFLKTWLPFFCICFGPMPFLGGVGIPMLLVALPVAALPRRSADRITLVEFWNSIRIA